MQKIITFVRDFLRQPGGRYLVVGGSVYVLELMMIVASQRMGFSAVTAVAIGFSVGLIVSFALQKVFTFRDKRIYHRILLPQIIAVVLLVIFNFSFTILMTKLLEDALPAAVIRTLALGATTIWNFNLYKTRIFNKAGELPPIT